VRSSNTSFNNLVLDEDTEKTVRALMGRLEKKGSAWSADFVEGKGTGGIILLHGEHTPRNTNSNLADADS
jgi:hypothetical protein